MNKWRLYITRMAGLFMICTFMACEDTMVVDPVNAMNAEDHYSETGEVYAAFIGLSATFRNLTEQTLILSELKGDLLRPTVNATEDFWNIYRYQADNNTAYSSSKKYYDLVINCNDFISRVIRYNQDFSGSIPQKIYRGMISQAVALKSWALFTIGQFWGEATVYNLNLENDTQQGMLTMNVDDLTRYLLEYLRGGEDGIDAFQDLDWKLVLDNPDINWEGCVIEAKAIEGEMNLWLGNYQEALNSLVPIVQSVKSADGKTTTYHHNVSDLYTGVNWSRFFRDDPSTLGYEVITIAPYNAAYHQEHHLVSYFAVNYPNLYYLAPTDQAMKLFESQTRTNYGGGDLTRGPGVSYVKSTQPFVSKYLFNQDKDEYASDAPIHIYRAAQIHLNIAEAYCFLGKFEEAMAFLDGGLKAYWTGTAFRAPFTGMDIAFQFNVGTRGRAGLLPVDQLELYQSCRSQADSIRVVAGCIADEVALELAYEGKRWQTLMRMARNQNNPSFLAERVALKFDQSEQAAFRNLLEDKSNWFIKDKKNGTLK